MKQILIFSGTSEGRELAEKLTEKGIPCIVCVATEYGKIVMEPNPLMTIRQGRLNPDEMKELMSQEEIVAVVDATHPFATEVSKNIRESVEKVQLPYFRLKRNTAVQREESEICHWFKDSASCGEYIKNTTGNVFFTTGSKELGKLVQEVEDKSRLYVRVLPSVESISLCNEVGIYGKQIIAMQGPFSEEMNELTLKEYGIKYLVTKETGKNGGFFEKIEAAKKVGAVSLIIGNPEKESGFSLEGILQEIEKLAQEHITFENQEESGSVRVNQNSFAINISVVGMGMGNARLLTEDAKRAIDKAEIIFGAKRLLEQLPDKIEKVPYYLAKDILGYLKEHAQYKDVAVLFSGDTGFYSGATKFVQVCKAENGIKKEKSAKEKDKIAIDNNILNISQIIYETKIYPGISSISYLASALGMSWQDADIVSVHGKEANVLSHVEHSEKTFLLVSGVKDVHKVGEILVQSGLKGITVYLGYQMSYEEEEIVALTPEQCMECEKEGLYACMIQNPNWSEKILTPGLLDEAFLRDKVPMTKEEVREISLCKLRLTPNSVVYDIGSGTGSISIECARMAESIQVYAIEKKEEAVDLLQKNIEKFDLHNITTIKNIAPEGMEDLPVPTHGFIGGSSGNLIDILKVCYEKNPEMRIVMNAITLETVGEMLEALKAFPMKDVDIAQIAVSKGKTAGPYHLMQANNPVYIVSFTFQREEDV